MVVLVAGSSTRTQGWYIAAKRELNWPRTASTWVMSCWLLLSNTAKRSSRRSACPISSPTTLTSVWPGAAMMLIASVASSALRPVRWPAWSMPMKSLSLIVPSLPLLRKAACPFTKRGKVTASVPLTGMMATEGASSMVTHWDWLSTAWGSPLPSGASFTDEMLLIVSTSAPSKNVSRRQPVTRMVSPAATPVPSLSVMVPVDWVTAVIFGYTRAPVPESSTSTVWPTLNGAIWVTTNDFG